MSFKHNEAALSKMRNKKCVKFLIKIMQECVTNLNKKAHNSRLVATSNFVEHKPWGFTANDTIQHAPK